MQKPVFPRILLFSLLYCVFFVALVLIQFTKQGGFTQRVGDFVVSGQYRQPGENAPPKAPNEYFLEGDTHIFFGGIDFALARENGRAPLIFSEENANEEGTLPERMVVSDDSLLFAFPGGTELEFSTQYTGGALEMRIAGTFAEGAENVVLPWKPQRRTSVREGAEGQLLVTAEGVNYSFGRSPMDAEKRNLILKAGDEPLSYRVIPERKMFSPEDFILSEAESDETYNQVINRWRDGNFSLWNRGLSGQNNEDVIVALEGEAVIRGTYKAAVSAIPASFLRGNIRTYESSVYFGGMGEAYRALITGERENLARISRLLNDKSLEFLKEPRIFEYFAVRGQENYMQAGLELVRTIDPAVLALDIAPGILEGFLAWRTFRPSAENPFERFVDQACFVISESLRTDATGRKVFSFNEGRGDTEFNLRLGKALVDYAGASRINSWAGIGRSLILTALSLSDTSGTVKAGLVLSENGEISEDTSRPPLTSAKLYRVLHPVDFYPHAAIIGSPSSGMWTWTAARGISGFLQNGVLDITVNFPAGETHYMILRGIRPFTRIQLYNIDYRTDPQFERYDSSGWAYYAQEQTLVIKMKHRVEDEHIRIFF